MSKPKAELCTEKLLRGVDILFNECNGPNKELRAREFLQGFHIYMKEKLAGAVPLNRILKKKSSRKKSH